MHNKYICLHTYIHTYIHGCMHRPIYIYACMPTYIHTSIAVLQDCHRSGKSQGNSRSRKSQGILEFVREIWNFVESQGNLRKSEKLKKYFNVIN